MVCNLILNELEETRRAFVSVRSCMIWVGVIVVVIVTGGKQSQILLRRFRTILREKLELC